MGQKNAVTRRFCGDKIRFADLVNGLYFQGREVIRPEELEEGNEIYASPRDVGSKMEQRKYLERSRDIKMRHVNGASIRLLAIEDQHYIDYTMPFRNMQYDVLEYQHQLEYTHMNEDCLEFLSVVMDSPGIWKNRKKYMNESVNEDYVNGMEGYNMCQAIKELIEDGRQEGRMETLKQSVENLMKSLSISLEKACELVGSMDDYENLKQMMQK